MPNEKDSQSMRIFTIVSFLIVPLLFVLLHWNSVNMPLDRDEGEYAYSAKVLLEGGLPYRDSFMQKPPMIIYTYALARLIAPPPAVWAPRLLALIFIIGASILISWMAYKEFGKKIGLISLWLIVPIMTFPPLLPFAANTEIFMLFPLMGVLAIYVWKKEAATFSDFFAAGFFAMVALLFKPISLLLVLFLFSYWLFEIWKKSKNSKIIAKFTGAIMIGFLTAIALFLGYFIVKDGGKSFWEVAITYNAYYIDQYGYSLDNFLSIVSMFFIKYWLILFIILAWALPKCNDRKLKFYMTFLLLGIISIYNVPNTHYYFMIIPFLAIISAIAINYLDEYLINKPFLSKSLFKNDPFLFTMILIFIITSSMIWPFKEQFTKSPEDLSYWDYNNYNGVNSLIESPVVAKQLSKITKPSDKVFIAGSEPQILYYADRLSSSRFVITYPLTFLNTPQKSDYQKETIYDLKKNSPAAIVVVRCPSEIHDPRESNLISKFLIKLLNNRYTLVGGFIRKDIDCKTEIPVSLENDPYDIMGKFFVYNKDNYNDSNKKHWDGYWQEPIELKDIEKTTLLLFKKK